MDLFLSYMIKKTLAKAALRFLQREIKELQKSPEKWINNCEYVTTCDGIPYYRFSNSGKIPIVRMEQMQIKVIELSKRLTAEESKLLLTIQKEALDRAYNAINQKGKAESIQVAVWANNEMLSRSERLMFHPDILIELCALSLVRIDENPFTIDKVIHEEKKKAFASEMPNNDFFLHLSLSGCLPDYEQLQAAFSELWNNHIQQVELSKKTYESIHLQVKS